MKLRKMDGKNLKKGKESIRYVKRERKKKEFRE